MPELEAYAIIKSILHEAFEPNHITYKDTESYLGILYDNNSRKWICRLYLEGIKKSVVIPDSENSNGVRYYINCLDDLYEYKDKIIESANKYAKSDKDEESHND
jgi:predicted type IV restriction endonuclease